MSLNFREKDRQSVELYRKYRPITLDEVKGQTDVVRMLKELFEQNKLPHAILLSGYTGCGKTTIGRIIQYMLKCDDLDFYELNCGDDNGIDTIRRLNNQKGRSALKSPCRIWLLDECFHKDTKVKTLDGEKCISDMTIGDSTLCLTGVGKVKHVFKNKVDINRVCKLTFNDGRIIFTTKEHEFLTNKGWMESQNLLKTGVYNFCEVGYTMNSRIVSNIHNESTNVKTDASLQILQEKFSATSELSSKMLFKGMSQRITKKGSRIWSKRRQGLSLVQNDIQCEKIQSERMLQHILCQQIENHQRVLQIQSIHKRECRKAKQEHSSFLQDTRGGKSQEGEFGENEGFQSDGVSRIYRKGESNEGNEGIFTCLEGGKRRQWEIYDSTDGFIYASGREKRWLENRTAHTNWNIIERKRRVSNMLQSRCWESYKENCNRSRWERPQIEKDYLKRCEKDPMFRKSWVVSVEIYKRGYNEQSFNGIIGSAEKNQGFVEFYDLEIEGNPSYFANGSLVHNCQNLSKDAMTAILKILEDTPPNLYIILATTDPQKLLKTIHTRCTEFKLKPLDDKGLRSIIDNVCKKEKIELDEEVLDKLISVSDGSARKSLVLLHQILQLSDSEEQLNCLLSNDAKKQAIDIARAIMDPRNKWQDVAKILEKCDEEPETIRHLILGYAAKVLLSGGKLASKAFLVISAFESPFYDSKRAGLIRACYEVMNSDN